MQLQRLSYRDASTIIHGKGKAFSAMTQPTATRITGRRCLLACVRARQITNNDKTIVRYNDSYLRDGETGEAYTLFWGILCVCVRGLRNSQKQTPSPEMKSLEYFTPVLFLSVHLHFYIFSLGPIILVLSLAKSWYSDTFPAKRKITYDRYCLQHLPRCQACHQQGSQEVEPRSPT